MTGKAHLPPVPPANRAPQGGDQGGNQGGNEAKHDGDIAAGVAEGVKASKDRNLASQGRQGNIKTNTTNQGYQQDR